MKLFLGLVLLIPGVAQAGKLVNQDVRQYFPSFGFGSTQSVTYTSAAASTTQILPTGGGSTELVQILASTDAWIAQGVNPVATNGGLFLPAKTPEVFEILSGQQLSAIQVSSGGILYVTHLPTFPASK